MIITWPTTTKVCKLLQVIRRIGISHSLSYHIYIHSLKVKLVLLKMGWKSWIGINPSRLLFYMDFFTIVGNCCGSWSPKASLNSSSFIIDKLLLFLPVFYSLLHKWILFFKKDIKSVIFYYHSQNKLKTSNNKNDSSIWKYQPNILHFSTIIPKISTKQLHKPFKIKKTL